MKLSVVKMPLIFYSGDGNISTFFCTSYEPRYYTRTFLVSFDIWSAIYYPPSIVVRGYSNSGRLSVCLSVTLSCLRDNLSKHG